MSTNARIKLRQDSYKKGIKAASCRRHREETAIRLRKNKREEGMRKRRLMSSSATAKAEEKTVAPSISGLTPTVEALPAIAQALRNPNPKIQYEATRAVRKLLSKHQDPPVLEVLKHDILPHLVNFLNRSDTCFEACWALTNIASTEHTKIVVQANACPHLVNLLRCPNAEVREQAAWCLGNVAGDSAEFREGLLGMPGCLQAVLLNIQQPANESLLRNVTWCLSNLCRGKPQPRLESIQQAFPVLCALLQSNDDDVVTDACWALSYVSDGEDRRIEAVVASGVVPHLVRLLGSEKDTIVTPSLRTLGNIVSGNDKCTQAALDNGILDALVKLVTHRKKAIRKETCWAISNITAGTCPQIQTAVEHPGLIEALLVHLTESPWEIRKEAAWAVSNIATSTIPSLSVKKLVDAGAIGPICALLDVADTRIVNVALDALEGIMQVGKKLGISADYEAQVETCNGLDMLEALQDHDNTRIYEKTISIVERYFQAEEEGPAENAPINIAAGGDTFAFKAPPAPAAPISKSINFNFGPPAAVPVGGAGSFGTFDFADVAALQ